MVQGPPYEGVKKKIQAHKGVVGLFCPRGYNARREDAVKGFGFLGWLGVFALLGCAGNPAVQPQPPITGPVTHKALTDALKSPQTLLFSAPGEGGRLDVFLKTPATTLNLTRHPGQDNWPQWTPDGRGVVFQSRRNGAFDLYHLDLVSGALRRLTHSPSHDYLPSVHPAGDRVYFLSRRPVEGAAEGTPHYFSVPLEGGEPTLWLKNTPGSSAPLAWSPDGEQAVLSFPRPEGEGADLWLLNRQGWRERRITRDKAYEGSPGFQPNGRWVVHYRQAEEQTASIELVQADGNKTVTVLEPGPHWTPRWLNDGMTLVVSAQNQEGDWGLYTCLAFPPGTDNPLIPWEVGVAGAREGAPSPLAEGSGEE